MLVGQRHFGNHKASRSIQQDLAKTKGQIAPEGCKTDDKCDHQRLDGREEPNRISLGVLSTAQHEHGSLDALAIVDLTETRVSLLPIPVLDFFPDGVRAHIIGLDLEDFAIG